MPSLAGLEGALAPLVAALLRVAVGLLLVPHGLRLFFGCFPNTGARGSGIAALAGMLERSGYRPGLFWAVVTALVQFIAAPLLALGLFTHLAALAVGIFLLGTAIDHGRKDGWFWNVTGAEYPLLWTLAAFLFAFQGGGPYSLDHWLRGTF